MMEHNDIQSQVDQLRDHIEDLRGKVDQSYDVLQNIQTTLSDLQDQVGQRRMPIPTETGQIMPPIRLVGRNLWLTSILLAFMVTVVAFFIFATPPSPPARTSPRGLWSAMRGH
jgi:hypothetical protein